MPGSGEPREAAARPLTISEEKTGFARSPHPIPQPLSAPCLERVVIKPAIKNENSAGNELAVVILLTEFKTSCS